MKIISAGTRFPGKSSYACRSLSARQYIFGLTFVLGEQNAIYELIMTLFDLESSIDEFAESGYFQLLDPSAKEHAGGILAAFLRECSLAGAHSTEALTGAIVESVLLGAMATLNLPLSARQGIPALLSAFFRFVSETGRFPPASQWERVVDSLRDRYIARFRQDGSIKGETFKKNYTDVNRNDPCPCGSGKKFKKCCMKLVSG